MTPWQIASLELLGVFALARLLEVVASALRRKALGTRAVTEPWWPAMVATHLFVLGGSAASVLLFGRTPPLPLLFGGLIVLLVATFLRTWAFMALGPRWNVRLTDPGSIVVRGPYRYIRHPNYLAVILEVAALPVVVGAYEIALVGSLANAAILALRIPFEEALLAAHHPAYRDLLRLPRFLPRL